MKQLLEEANDMLQGFSKKATVQSGPTLEQLQAQLDDLKKRGMKTLKLTRLQAEEVPQFGLIDSGATNPLRPLLPSDDLKDVERVWVSLADGRRTPMLINRRGVMISTNLNIEPIVPMGWLTSHGCEVIWSDGVVTVKHPLRGEIKVRVEMGCPQIERNLALELIQDFEKGTEYPKKIKKVEDDLTSSARDSENAGLVQWMEKVIDEHPVLSCLPCHIRDNLVATPGELKDLPVNRHRRKRLKETGYVLHLYAGPHEGYRLETAFQEVGLRNQILEIDVLRGDEHDVLGKTLYPALLRSALSGHIRGVPAEPKVVKLAHQIVNVWIGQPCRQNNNFTRRSCHFPYFQGYISYIRVFFQTHSDFAGYCGAQVAFGSCAHRLSCEFWRLISAPNLLP